MTRTTAGLPIPKPEPHQYRYLSPDERLRELEALRGALACAVRVTVEKLAISCTACQRWFTIGGAGLQLDRVLLVYDQPQHAGYAPTCEARYVLEAYVVAERAYQDARLRKQDADVEHILHAADADAMTASLPPRHCSKGHVIHEGIVQGVGYVACCDCDLNEEATTLAS